MDFNYTPAEEQFRMELRAFLAEALPEGWGETVFLPEDEDEQAVFRLDWERKLYEGGWSCIGWPKEYGGRDATLSERAIYAEELARARAPELINIIGQNLAGHTIIHHGTPEQKARFLPGIISSREVWCQGFSEPNAGSDLASIKTRAELKGDKFIVNGQKIWTSFAQHSQWCLALVRTSNEGPRHKGISLLLIDMRSPGITLRPLRQISGENEFNETFFDDVEVPIENLLGPINEGWRITMTTLSYERGPEDALGRQVRIKQELDTLIAKTTELRNDGKRLIDDPLVRQKLGRSIAEVEIIRLNCLRALSRYLAGEDRGSDASILKLFWSEVGVRMSETAMDVLGPLATLNGDDPLAVGSGRWLTSWLQSKAFTIYAGSSEIQRNIIGERVLGLPR
ncbi:acyl-CoA dehydrogenase [Novosphingobium colocasiae]|uniref:Acyl-CoA dehydrogenase FadE n=1 Tax=Novosphingobium colocasiae TaxID=1256513 RepID=A0A918UDB8_9SPHN|nr:acyl-CoA dehydrogenase [Novosphingobium colocasiae]GGY95757.1 putative acyl-CoA dehydrogenase FadE [Novosphingobium colocasiae]